MSENEKDVEIEQLKAELKKLREEFEEFKTRVNDWSVDLIAAIQS